MKPREELFRQLYERYSDEVHSFCVRRVGRALAEDAVAEVFTVAWRRLESVEPESERAWIYGVARNVIRNQWRAAQRKDRLAGRIKGTREVQPPQPDERVLLAEQNSAVLIALNGLRSTDREILVLSAWDDLSAAEIAQVLGISTNNVRQRIHRAMKRLATAMDQIEPALSPETERGGES